MSDKKTIFTGSKQYLEKSFLEELNYKIWSTKGARFEADKRLTAISKMSNISTSMLSAYLIIMGLISVYNLNSNLNSNLIGYIITALSIILLVLSQYENSQNYKMRAKEFHNCGLEISILYNKLRIFKTLRPNPSEWETKNFAENLANEYQTILSKYENHLPIDYHAFMIRHKDYFSELKNKDINRIKRKNFWTKCGRYILFITLPPIIIISLLIF